MGLRQHSCTRQIRVLMVKKLPRKQNLGSTERFAISWVAGLAFMAGFTVVGSTPTPVLRWDETTVLRNN